MNIIETYLDSYTYGEVSKPPIKPKKLLKVSNKKHHVIGKKNSKVSGEKRKKILDQLRRLKLKGRRLSYA